jgi:hypothetical protein
MLLVFAAAVAQVHDPLQYHDHITQPIVYQESIQSSWKLFQSVSEWLQDGPLHGLPSTRKEKSPVVPDNSFLEALSELLVFNEASVESEENKAVYRDAILQRRAAFGGWICSSSNSLAYIHFRKVLHFTKGKAFNGSPHLRPFLCS